MNQVLNMKVVVVTGGAGLLGKEFIRAIASAGGIAVIADCNQKAGLCVKEEIKGENHPGDVDYIDLDINSKESIHTALTYLDKQYGVIDALVNNAYPRNKHYGRSMMDVEYEDFCDNLSMNLGGYFLTSQQFAAYFLKQGYGSIVNIASIYGVSAPKFELYDHTNMTMPVEYAVIKSGLIHLTKYFAKAFKGKNIRVNAISPGGILDAQPESFVSSYRSHCLNKGMLDKSDISGTLIYLLSDAADYVNGQNIIIDDGFTL